MKEAVNFLRQIYSDSINSIATIVTAEAENNKNIILQYLENVKDYTEGLIEIVKNNE